MVSHSISRPGLAVAHNKTVEVDSWIESNLLRPHFQRSLIPRVNLHSKPFWATGQEDSREEHHIML
jgi:hypothetical protein